MADVGIPPAVTTDVGIYNIKLNMFAVPFACCMCVTLITVYI